MAVRRSNSRYQLILGSGSCGSCSGTGSGSRWQFREVIADNSLFLVVVVVVVVVVLVAVVDGSLEK